MICLGQPTVPDETGNMKFRYQIKLTAQLHVLLHTKPDLIKMNSDKVLWNRNTIWMPSATKKDNKYKYSCVPYNMNYYVY